MSPLVPTGHFRRSVIMLLRPAVGGGDVSTTGEREREGCT